MKKVLCVSVTLIYLYSFACECEEIKQPLISLRIIEELTTERFFGGLPKRRKEYQNEMTITCERQNQIPNKLPWIQSNKPVIILNIKNCTLPNVPLMEIFNNSKLSMFIDKLILTNVIIPAVFKNYETRAYSKGLFVLNLVLTNVTNVSEKFMYSFGEVYRMTVKYMDMPRLPPSRGYGVRPKVLTLIYSPVEEWNNCEMLSELHIEGITKEGLPLEWPKNCTLSELRMSSIQSDAVLAFGESVKHWNMELYVLKIYNSTLTELPIKLMRSPNLYHIDFSNNFLTDNAFLQFPMLDKVSVLNLSYNRLEGDFLIHILSKLYDPPQYIVLPDNEVILDGNKIVNISSNYTIKTALASLPRLNLLSLNYMDLEPDCLMHTFIPKLERLNLKQRQPTVIEHLQLHSFPRTSEKQLIVDLQGSTAKYVSIGPVFTESFKDIDRTKHWITKKGFKLIVFLDYIDCDCKNDVLLQALRKFPTYLSMPGLKCTNGKLFLEESIDNLNCRQAKVSGCIRRISKHENYTTTVDCSNNPNFKWPKPKGFIGMKATDNRITNLRNAYIPDTLEWLDLRNNNISWLNKTDTEKLFARKNRRIWLSDNPFRCQCIDAPFIEALHGNKEQIVDFYSLFCADQTRVYQVSIFERCRTGSQRIRFYKSVRPVKRIEKSYHCPPSIEHQTLSAPKTVIHAMSIYNCDLSPTPLKDVFKALNIDITQMDTLQLTDITILEPIPKNYSAELMIRKLKLTNVSLAENFLNSFTSTLYHISMENMKVPPIPTNINLEDLYLKNSSVESWTNCKFLRELVMTGLTQEQIPNIWPKECAYLKYLTLNSLTRDVVSHVEDSFNYTISLISLTVHNSALTVLPMKFLKNIDRLQNLDFSRNDLNDEALKQLPSLSKLTSLDLSNNQLTGEFIIDLPSKMPELKILKLDGNLFVHTFRNFKIKSALPKLTKLEHLSLNNMTLDPDCLMYSKFNRLEILNIATFSETPINVLMLFGLPSTGARTLTVNLKGRLVRNVAVEYTFTEDFQNSGQILDKIWLVYKGYKLIVFLDPVDCDCNNDLLYRALREFPGFLSMPDLKCSNINKGLLLDEKINDLSCRKVTIDGCRRKLSRHNEYKTVADCSNNHQKFRWPQPQRLEALNASGNDIHSLHKAYLPETLLTLDLSKNKISRLDNNETAKLFNISARQIWIAGNPIACDCENQHMILALQENHSQIQDFELVTCADGQPLRLVAAGTLCEPPGLAMTWAILGTLAALTLVAGLLLRQYWHALKVQLYAHGWFLSCLSEEDLDADRPYDAFISFAHGDDEYVMQKLLPRLESKPTSYNVCVHYRDWQPGEWIPAQIMKSVGASKRTMIVLSQNFVRSWWGVLEFRYAQANAMAEGRSRLLVLVLDDVLKENLSDELQGYLALNTYLRCDDPMFWQKLQYAMPHIKGRRNLGATSKRTFSNMEMKTRLTEWALATHQTEDIVE